jgi:hypothetical protein
VQKSDIIKWYKKRIAPLRITINCSCWHRHCIKQPFFFVYYRQMFCNSVVFFTIAAWLYSACDHEWWHSATGMGVNLLSAIYDWKPNIKFTQNIHCCTVCIIEWKFTQYSNSVIVYLIIQCTLHKYFPNHTVSTISTDLEHRFIMSVIRRLHYYLLFNNVLGINNCIQAN